MTDLLSKILERTTPGLEKALDLQWRRHEAISSNIANAETPMYRAVDVSFENELTRAFDQSDNTMLKTNSKHMDGSGSMTAHTIGDLSGVTKPDGNNVDIDIQMGKLAYNSGQYTNVTNLLRKQMGVLRRMITEASR
ncbi:MAG: flagellar basal body rod protein FlgB [Oligoflexia bacterium]|nr:flagellar basal body rod protein FlgB [Oligoflexia bacterium]